jgi:hypothetical protein
MEIGKRFQKAHINKNEIPELCIDIGAVVVKISFFEIHMDPQAYEFKDQNESNINFTAHKKENREKLKLLLNEYFQTAYSYSMHQIKIKDLIGTIHCCLFRTEKFDDFMRKFHNLNLNRPFMGK